MSELSEKPMMRSRHAYLSVPQTYAQAAYSFGRECHRLGIASEGNPFPPGSDEHEAYGDAQLDRERWLREVHGKTGVLLGDLGALCPK